MQEEEKQNYKGHNNKQPSLPGGTVSRFMFLKCVVPG